MFKSHKEINKDYCKIILEETGEFKIRDVPLVICSEIIEEHREMEETIHAELLNFTIEATKDGKRIAESASSLAEADRIMDEIIEFGRRQDVIMVLRQNNRLIRGYMKGEVIYPTSYVGKVDVASRKVL